MSNILKYSIMDEILYGTIDGESFSMRAFSGGGRGSTSDMELYDLKHWSSRKKAPPIFNKDERGGPLPIGFYLVEYYGVHEHLGRCASLGQTLLSLLQTDYSSPIGLSVTDRSGFYIHGRGPKGSDGCIVPANKVDLKNLLDAIESASTTVVLIVHSEGMNAERLELAKRHGNVA